MQERVEKERKEKAKLSKKERTDRLKAEGKFMTAKQKEAQRRAKQMLDAMKAQGREGWGRSGNQSRGRGADSMVCGQRTVGGKHQVKGKVIE